MSTKIRPNLQIKAGADGTVLKSNSGIADWAPGTTVSDTNSIDLTLTGASISADVKNNSNGGLETTAAGLGIKLDPNTCNGSTLSATGLLVHTKHLPVSSTQVYPDIALTGVGQVAQFVRVISNPSACNPLIGMVYFNWNGAMNGAARLEQQVLLNAVQQNSITSLTFGGGATSGGYDVSTPVGFAGDNSFGASYLPVTIPPSGSITVTLNVRCGIYGGSTLGIQSVQIAFNGVA